MERPLCCRVSEEEGEEEIELPGFRFHPTDEELVSFYLRKRVEGRLLAFQYLITDLDIYKCDPWDLPKMAKLGEGQREWYFFCPRDRKYRNSTRPNRVTLSGFWKATGTDRQVYSGSSSSQCIGLKKSLVFYVGRASKGTKTDWMMHEFRLPSPPNCSHKDTCWAICRIFKRKASTTQCTVPKTQASIIGETPCSGGPTLDKSLAILHAHANYDSFGGEDLSEEDSKSQNTTPTSTPTFNFPRSISPSNYIPSSYTSISPSNYIPSSYTLSDEIAMGCDIKPLESAKINTPSSMQRQPLTLRVSKSFNSGANWADDFWSSVFTPPITKPSDNGQPGDGNTLFFDQPFQESMQFLTPGLGHLTFSPQGNPALPLWEQPDFVHDSLSFYAMSR